jgi:glycosyltransferase involved in cell wall biosynthesis
LAMRAWRHAQAFEDDELLVVVLPVAGTTSQLWWKPAGRRTDEATSRPLDVAQLMPPREHLAPLFADRSWRTRFAAMDPLPQAVRHAHPSLARTLVDLVGGWRPDAVVVFRSYMAPLGLALAEHMGCSRTVLDLDEDDVAVLASLGSPDAPNLARVVGTMAPEFSVVTLASQAEADAVVQRYRLENTAIVPNGIVVPERPLDYRERSRTVAMVGNFTYQPNLRGAQWLRDEVWPHLTALLDHPCALRLVGPGIGEVDDVEPVYRAAAVMAVPLFEGGGTRLKVLEAWALGRPVVSTTTGVAGLEVVPGREALVADDPGAFARALRAVLDEPGRAEALIEAGRAAVRAYSAERVEAALRAITARRRRQPSQ